MIRGSFISATQEQVEVIRKRGCIDEIDQSDWIGYCTC